MKRQTFVKYFAATLAAVSVMGASAAQADEPRLKGEPEIQEQRMTFTAIPLPAGFEGQYLTNNAKALGYTRGRDGVTPIATIYNYRTGMEPFWKAGANTNAISARPDGLHYLIQNTVTNLPTMLTLMENPSPPVSFTLFKYGVTEINNNSLFAGTDWIRQDFHRAFRLVHNLATPEYAPLRENSTMLNLGDNGVALINKMNRLGSAEPHLWHPDNRLTPLVGGRAIDMSTDGTYVAGSTEVNGATLWIHGVEQDLGLGKNTRATLVNNGGDVIIETTKRNGTTLSLLRNDKLTPLEKLVKLEKGWEIASASDLNDQSEILVELRYVGRKGRQAPAGFPVTQNAILLPR